MQLKRRDHYEIIPTIEERAFLEWANLADRPHFRGSDLRHVVQDTLNYFDSEDEVAVSYLNSLFEKVPDSDKEAFRQTLLSMLNNIRPSLVLSLPEDI